MRFHDPNRPTIGHRKAFLGGMVVIPQICIYTVNDPDAAIIEISMMLPVKELDGFISKWFTTRMHVDELPDWLMSFDNDPEKTILETFTKDEDHGGFTPDLLPKKPSMRVLSSTQTHLLDDL